jgi:transcription antitermination factor NusG
VRVKSGPLIGLMGVVVHLKNRTGLVVSFDLIQRSATVKADQIDVEPLD